MHLYSIGIQNYRVSIGPTRYKLQCGKEDIWTTLEGNIFYHLMMMMQGGCGGGEVVELSEVVAQLKDLKKLQHRHPGTRCFMTLGILKIALGKGSLTWKRAEESRCDESEGSQLL